MNYIKNFERGEIVNSEIYDARLQHYLRSVIRKLPYNQQLQLKSLSLCNTRLIFSPNVEPAVFLLRSEGHDGKGAAKFFGQMTCKNPWACPHCSAMMMYRYKEKIALAIDALRADDAVERMFGFMMTFTIPHLRFQSCKEVTDILYNTFRSWSFNMWQRRKNKNGSIRWQGATNQFVVDCDVRYYVRCAEYTWSELNGWHPHFHNIYWVPRGNQDKVLDWQDKLNQYWLTVAERETLKYWDAHELHGDTHEEREKKCQSLFEKAKKQKVVAKNVGVKISTDKDGKILESLASDYLCGWGADSEVTGNFRKQASAKNFKGYDHFTPYEILERAANGDKEMEEKYIEFMLQVTKKPVHHRVDFKAGMIKKIIQPYRQKEGYKKVVKKKQAEHWELVMWFSKKQWFALCDKDKDSPVLSNILYLAAINRKDLLKDYLKSFDIDIIERPHLFGQHVENIFNGLTKEDLSVA